MRSRIMVPEFFLLWGFSEENLSSSHEIELIKLTIGVQISHRRSSILVVVVGGGGGFVLGAEGFVMNESESF